MCYRRPSAQAPARPAPAGSSGTRGGRVGQKLTGTLLIIRREARPRNESVARSPGRKCPDLIILPKSACLRFCLKQVNRPTPSSRRICPSARSSIFFGNRRSQLSTVGANAPPRLPRVLLWQHEQATRRCPMPIHIDMTLKSSPANRCFLSSEAILAIGRWRNASIREQFHPVSL